MVRKGFSKYSAKPMVVDGIRFASRKEARRYSVLKLLQRAGEIGDIQLQVTFSIEINGMHICNYRADFVYWEKGFRIIEDAKGVRTDEYKLKKKLMEAVHNIKIKET
jgi:hypothetical protein